ncbi:hypothetical protein ACFWY5_29745 [Nonomuraea sp. NPDC059007]|uniref:hypothetical protein n=1 Tax=Nonomuraea sp. NPDC059007 TaxID=3346692 RepID=UPI0036BD56C9
MTMIQFLVPLGFPARNSRWAPVEIEGRGHEAWEITESPKVTMFRLKYSETTTYIVRVKADEVMAELIGWDRLPGRRSIFREVYPPDTDIAHVIDDLSTAHVWALLGIHPDQRRTAA